MAKAKKISRQRAYQLRHKALGLCARCGEKAINANFCQTHLDAVNKRRRAKRKEDRLMSKHYDN